MTSIFKNHKGTILWEALFSLFICSFSIMLLAPLFVTVEKSMKNLSWTPQQEWHIAMMQIEDDISIADSIYVRNNKLYLVNEEEIKTVNYEIYSNLLRRRVDSQGHEVVLLKVSQVFFKDTDHYITISLERMDGKLLEKRFPKQGNI